MAEIFISYNSARYPIAKYLSDILENRGYSTWWDINLIAGEHFPTRLQEELDSASVNYQRIAPMFPGYTSIRPDEWKRAQELIAFGDAVELQDLGSGADVVEWLKQVRW